MRKYILLFLLPVCLFLMSLSLSGQEDPRILEGRRKALEERAKFRPGLKTKAVSPPPQPVRKISGRQSPVPPGTAFRPAVRKKTSSAVRNNTNTASQQVRIQQKQPGTAFRPAVRQIPVHTAQPPPSPVKKLSNRQIRHVPGRPAPVRRLSAPASAVRQNPMIRTAAKPAANTVRIRMIRVGQERYCYLNDVAKYYRMGMRYYKNGVELFAKGRSIRFYNEKRTGSINYVPVTFLFPPVLRAKTQYFIHEKDVAILIAAVNSMIYTNSPVKTIMLDPGHGGTDFGALGKNIHEKQMNLATALQLRASLTALGYKVIMTRAKDQTLTLDQRTALCKGRKPDLFLSIHCNAAANKGANGIETFAATPFGAPSTGKKTAVKLKAPDPGNAFDRNNYRLAYEIQKSLIAQTRASDRGVKVARYKVIRDASCPAALVEIGFITNSSEQKKFIDPSYRKKIVDGLALGIHNYAKALVLLKQTRR